MSRLERDCVTTPWWRNPTHHIPLIWCCCLVFFFMCGNSVALIPTGRDSPAAPNAWMRQGLRVPQAIGVRTAYAYTNWCHGRRSLSYKRLRFEVELKQLKTSSCRSGWSSGLLWGKGGKEMSSAVVLWHGAVRKQQIVEQQVCVKNARWHAGWLIHILYFVFVWRVERFDLFNLSVA